MNSYRSLVVPLDGSPLSERAISVAARLALGSGASVHLMRAHQVLMPEDVPGGAEWESWTRDEEGQYLRSVAEELRNGGVPRVTADLVDDLPVEAICRHACLVEADLIVMATHGRTGFSRLWFGSVADGVVRRSMTPVLLVRAGDHATRGTAAYERILVPLDGSPVGERIIPRALQLAIADRSHLLLARIAVPVPLPVPTFAVGGGGVGPETAMHAMGEVVEEAEEYLHDIVRRIRRRYPALDIETLVHVHPQPAVAIGPLATAQNVDLIAMATHGRGGSRLLVGSTADKVLRGTSTALLVCRA